MKTPFTDASTIIVHAGGKAFPVTPAGVAQMLEIRLKRMEYSQDVAWGIIRLADWKQQSIQWQVAAREWQTEIFVNKELPLDYTPGPRPQGDAERPKDFPTALRMIEKLRAENHDMSMRLQQIEALADDMEKSMQVMENDINEHKRQARSLQSN